MWWVAGAAHQILPELTESPGIFNRPGGFGRFTRL
jgi:hypothetical protein